MTEALCILVIDDNPDDRALAMRALRAEFASLRLLEVGTETGFAAAFEQGGFDAVVTDYELKWSDGLQILKQIRHRYPQVPVVMFTNTGSEEVCAAAMREGLHDYILKKANHYVMLPAAVRSGLAMVAARRAVQEHQQALERALASEKEARLRAEQADRLKDEFLATLSHELRTPLNAIMGWAHVLQRASDKPETILKGAQVIERNVKAQARIIEDLLDVSAIVTGKLRLDHQPVELVPVLEAAVEAVMAAADAKQLGIDRELDVNVGAVAGDATRLQQVFWNLLSNAVKFTPAGGQIKVRLRPLPGGAEVTVSDSGEGMARDFLPYAFDRLRQADGSPSRRHSGLGLGLSIVRHLVTLHGGEVEAESAGLAQGSTFVVRLPLAPSSERRAPPAQAASAPEQGRLAETARVKLDNVQVLIVEDEADARELMLGLVRECGADGVGAASAAEAVASFGARRPDVLVSDIGMPGEDGYALIGRIRQLEGSQARVPAIALTAFARTEDRRRTLMAGFQVHIAKPVDPAELLAAIASLVGRTG